MPNQMPNRFEEKKIERQYGLSMEDYADPNFIKNYQTAYEIFQDRKIYEIRKDQEAGEYDVRGMDQKDMVKQCAKAWAMLSFEEKQGFDKLADEDRKRFEEAIKQIP